MLIFLFALIALLTAISVSLLVCCGKAKHQIAQNEESIKSQADLVSKLSQENKNLERFRICVNAEAKAEEILSSAEREASLTISNARKEAEFIISKANDTAQEAIAEAARIRESVVPIEKEAMAKAEKIIKQANERAKAADAEAVAMQLAAECKSMEIIVSAESRARAIAGNAYDLVKHVDEYKAAIQSMCNIIQGYGNEYIKPTESVLDGLAEEFGYTEAGKELAKSRAVRKKLSESLKAATSDYVENKRHDTAVRFVIDAFNGKVDSILSLVKENNVGILEQKIKDAYNIVNVLGSAFRDTKITQQYLDECLDELKWAVAVIALKNREKEEQRAIKARIREEERVRREYEKAIRDAEKQEAAIRKAIEKATAKLAKANEEQRVKYESQLVDLQKQLAEAEEKNQRALSMAQQTRSGHVYIISNIGSFGENVYKIGMTRRLEPLDRVRELGDASVPFPFDVHAMIYSDDAPTLETELHKLFSRNQVNKVNPRKEFFRMPIADIRDYFDQKEISVQWTIKADAAQYRETLALEKAFENNRALESKWTQTQNEAFSQIDVIDEDDEAEEDEG